MRLETKLMNNDADSKWQCFGAGKVILLSLIWLGLVIAGPGYFPKHIDDVYYKEPGYNWALNHRFVSPALEGYGGEQSGFDVVFAGYPPLYPFTYGLWLQLFPHSLRSAIAFDATIRFLLVMWCLFGLPKLLPGLSRGVVGMTALAVCVLGTWGRPDELAMLFGLWALTVWVVGKRWLSAMGGGALLGLCLSTSWPAFIVLCAWFLPVCWYLCWQAPCWRGFVRRCLIAVLVCAALGLLILVPYYSRDGAMAQMASEPSQQFMAGIFWSFQKGTIMPYLHLWWFAMRNDIFMVPLYIALCTLAIAFIAKMDRFYRACLMGGVLGYAFIMIGMPHQGYYYWFLFPLLFSIVLWHIRSSRCVTWALGIAILLAINPKIRECIKAYCLPVDQTLSYSQRMIENYVPTTASVLTDARSYYVIRPRCNKVYVTDAVDSLQKVISRVDYCVFSFHHLGKYEGLCMPDAWMRDSRATYLKEHFEVIYEGLPSPYPSWHGVTLGITPIGYGVVVYRRRTLVQ